MELTGETESHKESDKCEMFNCNVKACEAIGGFCGLLDDDCVLGGPRGGACLHCRCKPADAEVAPPS